MDFHDFSMTNYNVVNERNGLVTSLYTDGHVENI